MQQLEKRDIRFESSDGNAVIAGAFYTHPTVQPFCVLQIAHGMCEYLARYEGFAAFLVANGVAVCGNDHIGHGQSAAGEGDLGYFGEKGGRGFALQDMRQMNSRAHKAFPGLPVVLLGHSMGSFFARQYAVQWPETIDGLIISGTGGPNPLAPAGIALAKLLMRTKGPRSRPAVLHNMAFGAYLKQIPNAKTPHDWISRDEEIVARYAADPFCTFHFTAAGFHEVFSALRDVSSPKWAVGVRKNMPVMLFSGDADPVGDYGKGPAKVRDWLHGAGVKHITYKMYEGGRHEMLNETNRQQVYTDVLAFLNRWFKPAQG